MSHYECPECGVFMGHCKCLSPVKMNIPAKSAHKPEINILDSAIKKAAAFDSSVLESFIARQAAYYFTMNIPVSELELVVKDNIYGKSYYIQPRQRVYKAK